MALPPYWYRPRNVWVCNSRSYSWSYWNSCEISQFKEPDVFYSYNFKEILKYLKYEFLNCLMLIFFSHGIVILSMANIMQAKKIHRYRYMKYIYISICMQIGRCKKKIQKSLNVLILTFSNHWQTLRLDSIECGNELSVKIKWKVFIWQIVH